MSWLRASVNDIASSQPSTMSLVSLVCRRHRCMTTSVGMLTLEKIFLFSAFPGNPRGTLRSSALCDELGFFGEGSVIGAPRATESEEV